MMYSNISKISAITPEYRIEATTNQVVEEILKWIK
jgi:hypothetical protein